MTDGRSQDDVRGPANLMRRRGVKIFSLGIGKRYNMRQLLQMSGNRRKVFTADFKNLGSVVRAIKQKACRGEEEKFSLGWFWEGQKHAYRTRSSMSPDPHRANFEKDSFSTSHSEWQ